MARLLRLDRMEIIGFKSFYGRTRFEFPDGITAVVGPNGCGKSNIGDAISWVLGEQKPSSLRSDRMEDVIFNGSDGRRPLGMAEVSLHFKNLAMLQGEKGAGAACDGGGNGHGDGNGRGGGHGHAGVAEATDAAAGSAAWPIPEATDRQAEGAAPPPEAEIPAGEAQDRSHPTFFSLEEIPEDVVLTRRVYRSGESEYSLNGQRCRLKDIQDLLARTDIGSRLYSTIEQGKIDQILVARPRERRAMFEEAAGILGYKTRRRQAEMKLEATQSNLMRLSDITAEVEKQIGSLKRQASKARRYRRLMETLRDRRLCVVRRRLAALDADREAAGRELANLRAQEAAAVAALSRGEAEVAGLRLRLEEGEAAARRRREEIHSMDLEIDRLHERLRSGEEQARELAGRIAEAGQEAEALLSRAVDQEARRAARDAAIASEAARIGDGDAVLRRLEAGLDHDGGEIVALEAALEGTRADLLRHLDRASALQRSRTVVEEQIRSERAAFQGVEKRSADLRAGRDALVAEIAGLEVQEAAGRDRLGASRRALEALQEEERGTAAAAGAAEGRLEELRGRESALGERLAALEEMARGHAGHAEGIGAILKGDAGVRARGVAGEDLEVPRGLERAVEATLDGLLEAVIVEEPADAARGVEHLRRAARGRVSFAVAGRRGEAPDRHGPALPEALAARPGVLGRLSGRVSGASSPPVAEALARALLVEDLGLAIDLHAAHPGWEYVTLQGDIVRVNGVITGGDGRALEHGVLARRAELEDVRRQVSEAAGARTGAMAEVRERQRALAAIRERLSAAEAERDRDERAAIERDLVRKQKRADLTGMEETVPELLDEQGRLERAIAAAGPEADSLTARIEAAETRRREVEETIRGAAAGLVSRRAALEVRRREAAEAGAELAASRQRASALEAERRGLDEAIAETRAAAARRAAAQDEWTARVAALADQDGALKRQLEEARAGRAGAAAGEEAAHAGLAYDRSVLHAREESVRQERAAWDALRAGQQERELRLARADARLEALAATCRDDLGTTVEDLRAAPLPGGEETPLEECEKELEAIKADLEALGPVNLMAIEQHDELEERFNFLTAQKKDLEDSVASLRETIRKINRQSRERFTRAFEAIQGHFQETFRRLFGGGKAELRLQEDEEDVLEAGIEIVAQPPGKRLRKIGLLSGGEKALTAAALLFSLFRYRPSPFCVLDEVDAPLDEANIERFTELLKALREETQFILITHNRKSMEVADLLYGVTMEEPGVSKVLPLRFE
ncbi:MAG: chromosome segregation protein SMC [Acidobacteria bacterium]|nr:chromosome segregation protein SMC [Acidobacteriota bacterium]